MCVYQGVGVVADPALPGEHDEMRVSSGRRGSVAFVCQHRVVVVAETFLPWLRKDD